MRVPSVIVLTIALCAGPRAAHAQATSAMDVGTGVSKPTTSVWARESRLAPTLQVSGARGSLNLVSELSERAGSVTLLRAGASGRVTSGAFGAGRLRLSLEGSAMSDSTAQLMLFGPPQPTATAALSARFNHSGVWLGSTAQRAERTALVTGIWHSLGNAIFSLSATTRPMRAGTMSFTTRVLPHVDSIPSDTGFIPHQVWDTLVDTTSTLRERAWSEVQARADWGVSRFLLSAVVNVRPRRDSVPSNMWGRVSATTLLSQRIAFVASAGISQHVAFIPAPAADLHGTSHVLGAQRFASIGLRLTRGRQIRQPLPAPVRPDAAGLVLVREHDDVYRITLHVPNARTVEISGDFVAWHAVSLRETSPNTWEVTLPLTPGTHRINVRVDGDAWTAPPGVATVDDEFNGHVGVIVIPALP